MRESREICNAPFLDAKALMHRSVVSKYPTIEAGDVMKLEGFFFMNKVVYFSLIFISQIAFSASPGGVDDSLELWLRADQGITTLSGRVRYWDDQSELTSNHSGQYYYSKRPSVGHNLAVEGQTLNFNPTVAFDGVNDLLVVKKLQLDDGASIFAVGFNGLQGATGSQFKPFIISEDAHGANTQDEGFLLVAGRSNTNDGDVLFIPPHKSDADSGYCGDGTIVDECFDETVRDDVASSNGRAAMWLGLDGTDDHGEVYRDGQLKQSTLAQSRTIPDPHPTSYTTGYQIGGSSHNANRYYKGTIAEIIAFDEKLTPEKIAKVNS